MLVTAKEQHAGQTFHRALLSEYNASYTLDNYVPYFALKSLVRQLNVLCKAHPNVQPSNFMDSPNTTTAPSFSAATLKISQDKAKLIEEFFALLQKSLKHVKDFQRDREKEAIAALQGLKSRTEEEIRSLGKDKVAKVYHLISHVAAYQDLNFRAYGKILRKFFERCCTESLSLQRAVRKADDIIAKSTLGAPLMDASAMLDEVLLIFATVFRASYEDTMAFMKRNAARDTNVTRRILPTTDTLFFQRHFAHREVQGRFAVKLTTGTASRSLGKLICEQLQCDLFHSETGCFANGEVSVVMNEAVRGDDVFVVQSLVATEHSLSATIMELALLLQTALMASAKRITAVIPYLAYTKNTASVSAMAEVFVQMGCTRVITVDLYREQIEGMFQDCPVENVSAKFEFIKYLTDSLRAEGHDFKNLVVVSPDSETVARAHSFADSFMKYAKLTDSDQFVPIITAVKRVHATETPSQAVSLERCGVSPSQDDLFPSDPPLGASAPAHSSAFLNAGEKLRTASFHPGASSSIDIVGHVARKDCIVIDCVVDEGINVCKVASVLKRKGATRVIAVVTHAVLSKDAVERIAESDIDQLLISDSIFRDDVLKNAAMARKTRIVSIAPLLAEAIQKVHTENALSRLYEK